MDHASGRNFFISYETGDRPWAEWIAAQLEAAGFSTVYQAADLRPGRNFAFEMHRALSTSERTIAILTPDYLRSDFGTAEWLATFTHDPTGEKKGSSSQYGRSPATRRACSGRSSTPICSAWTRRPPERDSCGGRPQQAAPNGAPPFLAEAGQIHFPGGTATADAPATVLPSGLEDMLRALRRLAEEQPYSLPGQHRIPLSVTYVQQSVASAFEIRRNLDPELDEASVADEDRRIFALARPFDEVFTQHEHLVIEGAAGLGKSSLGQRLVAELTDTLLSGDPASTNG